MAVNSRDTLKDYCLRQLGEPVIEVNVDPDQIEDRIDEALEYFREFNSDATLKTYLKHQVTASDIANGYITLNSDIIQVVMMFPVSGSSMQRGFFDIKYQLHLNDIANLQTYMGDLAYYEQIQQYLSLIDMKLNGYPQVQFSQHQNRLYIHGDFTDGDIQEGDYIVAEVYQLIDPATHTSVWNDKWMKEYSTALIKKQWGQNLIKFEGMQLPGGVTINGRQLYEDALQEIEKLREDIRLEHEMPVDFYVG